MTDVPGRFEAIDEGQSFTVVVDYAHPPDSLATVPLLRMAFERQGIEAPVTAGLHRVLAGESSPDRWLETMSSEGADRATVGE